MKLIRIEMRAMCHQGEESLQSGEALFRYSIPRLKTNMQIQCGLKKKKKKKKNGECNKTYDMAQ